MPFTRRAVLRLGMLAAGAVASGRCGSAVEMTNRHREGKIAVPPVTDGTAAPDSARSGPGGPGHIQRLGLGGPRDGALYVPANYEPSKRGWPLTVFLHGAGGEGERTVRRLSEEADRAGLIVLAPDSRAATWDLIQGSAGPDVEFIETALRQTLERYDVDRSRLTFSGFSDGASYALSLALVNGETFRGVAAFSPGFIQLPGALEGRPRVFLSHGRSDQVLPFERCGSAIAARLRGAGYDITFEPFDGRHEIPEETLERGFAFIVATPS
jgi:phospholipase/carboxylesterase